MTETTPTAAAVAARVSCNAVVLARISLSSFRETRPSVNLELDFDVFGYTT